MKTRLCLTLVLFGALLFHIPSPSRAQNPPPGTSTGQKIGTIVSAAINTALPGVSAILNLLPKKSNGQPKDSVKPDEVKAAVEAARKDLLKAALENVKPVSAVSNELQTLNKFLTPTVVASENLIRIQTRFSTSPQPIPDALWAQQDGDWAVAKARLNDLSGITKVDLDKVRDLWLRDKLSNIKAKGSDLVARLDVALKDAKANKAVGLVPDLLKDLIALLSDVSMAVGYELSDLQNDIGELAKWAGGGQGPAIGEHFLTADQKAFKAKLDEKYPLKP